MKRYTVCIEYQYSGIQSLEIEAGDEEQACKQAIEDAHWDWSNATLIKSVVQDIKEIQDSNF